MVCCRILLNVFWTLVNQQIYQITMIMNGLIGLGGMYEVPPNLWKTKMYAQYIICGVDKVAVVTSDLTSFQTNLTFIL